MSNEVIGIGLPWPQSFDALMEHYGHYKAVAAALGMSNRTSFGYAKGEREPKYLKSRVKFIEYGWTQAELPVRVKDLTRTDRRRRATVRAVGAVTFASLMADRKAGCPR